MDAPLLLKIPGSVYKSDNVSFEISKKIISDFLLKYVLRFN